MREGRPKISFAEAMAGLRRRIENGDFPEEEPPCPLSQKDHYPSCDGYGNLISIEIVDGRSYSCAKPCPVCLGKNAAKMNERHLKFALKTFAEKLPFIHKEALLNPDSLKGTDCTKAVGAWLGSLKPTYDKKRIVAGRGLILVGPPGIGKTIAAVFAVGEALRLCPNLLIRAWWNFSDLIEGHLHGNTAAGTSWAAQKEFVRKQIDTAGMIVLDDLGRAKRYDNASLQAQQDILFRALSRGVNDRIPVILIGNLRYDALKGIVGTDAGRSRLDSDYWMVREIVGQDLRQRVA